jgi:hypothetical protein
MNDPLTLLLDRLISEVEIRAQVEAERDAIHLAHHGDLQTNQQLRQQIDTLTSEADGLRAQLFRYQAADRAATETQDRRAHLLGEAIRRLRDWRDRSCVEPSRFSDNSFRISIEITPEVRDELTHFLAKLDQEDLP